MTTSPETPDPWQPAPSYGQVWGQPYVSGPSAQPSGQQGPWEQGPYGPWTPPGGQQPVSTNGWAITSLVTGILPLPPIAIATAVVGLVQTRRRHQPGHGLAVAGLVLGLLWSLVAAGLVTAAAQGAFDSPSTLGTVADAGSTTVGTCLDVPDSGRSSVVDCDVAHTGEVYLVRSLGRDAWPGSSEVAGRADDACYAAFPDYVGGSYDDSAFDYGDYAPDEAEWRGGERRVVCVVEPYDDDSITGSVRGRERHTAALSRLP